MKKILLAVYRKQARWCGYLPTVFLFLLILACLASTLTAGQAGQPSPVDSMTHPCLQGIRNVVMTGGDACPDREEIIQKARSLQMPFIANSGQVNEHVRFYAKTFGGTVFVTNEGVIVYALPGFGKTSNYRSNGSNGANRLSGVNGSIGSTRSIALKETIVGAKIAGIAGEQPAITKVNYFTGNNRSKWKANVPTYNMVNMGEVCKGIGLHLKAYGDNVEKLFCIKPGASPGFIKV